MHDKDVQNKNQKSKKCCYAATAATAAVPTASAATAAGIAYNERLLRQTTDATCDDDGERISAVD